MKPSQYPQQYQDHKAAHPHPVMVEEVGTLERCINCKGKGFVVAFFPDSNKTYPLGLTPITPKGKILKWIQDPNNPDLGGWMIGEHRVYDCPVCR